MPDIENIDASKRRLLQLSAACAAEVIMKPIPTAENISRAVQVGHGHLQALRSRAARYAAVSEIEKSLHVNFDNITDNRLLLEKILRPRNPGVPSVWEYDRVMVAAQALRNLPEHLRYDERYGESLHLLLDSKNFCCSNPETTDPVISVDYRMFRPDTPVTAKRILAHETTHLYAKRLNQDAVRQARSRDDLERMSWEAKVSTLLEGDRRYFALDFFDRFPVDLKRYDQVIAVVNEKGTIEDCALSKEEEDQMRFLEAAVYGLTSADEFIAATSENYILGKEYFTKWYSHYFSPQIAQRMYTFQKDTFFKGFEY